MECQDGETLPVHGRPGDNIFRLNYEKSFYDVILQMKGIEIYDLWLRTGHGDPLEWLEFMCEGDGPFGDCLENKLVDAWPGEVCEGSKEKCDSTVTLSKNQKQS